MDAKMCSGDFSKHGAQVQSTVNNLTPSVPAFSRVPSTVGLTIPQNWPPRSSKFSIIIDKFRLLITATLAHIYTQIQWHQQLAQLLASQRALRRSKLLSELALHPPLDPSSSRKLLDHLAGATPQALTHQALEEAVSTGVLVLQRLPGPADSTFTTARMLH
jgi:hypothetical protein